MSDDERDAAQRREMREENHRRLDGCTADIHEFRAPPPESGVKNWATCKWCQGRTTRQSAVMYIAGVRAGLVMASSMAMQSSADIREESEFALMDKAAPREVSK